MAMINFNGHGYLFQEGTRNLRTSFQSAVSALESEIENKREDLASYLRSLDQGGEWIGEREEGHVLWSNEQVLEMDIEQGLDAVNDLRKAFAIAAYHHWERSARRWTETDHARHDDLVKAVEADGIPVHEKLHGLRDLVNLLKHDNEKWAGKLRQSWPGILRDGPRILKGRIDWYQAVQLTNDRIQEVLDTVALSGPFATPHDREQFIGERLRAE